MKGIIQDVQITPLKQIADDKGAVLHVLRSDSEGFLGFGECYCSETLPGVVKAWKKHRLQTQNITVPVGKLLLVIYDDREGSDSYGIISTLTIGRTENYCRITIPPAVWYGFKALGTGPALIVNCVDMPHDPSESERLPEDATSIPYSWTLQKEVGVET